MSAVTLSDTFVGRSRELSVLMKGLNDHGREVYSAFIEGTAGIGKTALLMELLRHAEEKGARVLKGHCYHVPEAGPYFPFIQILSELRWTESPAAELVETLEGDTLSQPALGQLGEDVRGRRSRFLTKLSDLILGEVASGGTILCVEDIQWADVGSLLVLNNLLDVSRAGFYVVCTGRMDEPMDTDVRQLVSRIEQKSRRIVLRGLAAAEVRQLVHNLIGPGEITDDETRALRSITDGNPLFLRELLLHLKDQGFLARHRLMEAARRSRTPERLLSMVDMRLRSLDAGTRRTMSVCSVVGVEFSIALVARVMGRPEAAVEDDLGRCAELGIVRHLDSVATTRYAFAHALLGMRLYETLRPSLRRQLHRKIAEAADPDDVPLSVAELARHHALGFGAAGGSRAVAHCREAAEQAERLYGYESAAHFWELAIKCAGRLSRRTKADLHERLGWALWAAGKWKQAAEVWAKAVSLLETPRDYPRAASIALALGDMHRWRSDLEESQRWLERALSLGLPNQAERGRALALLGGIRRFRGDPEALNLLEEADDIRRTSGGDATATYWLSYGFLIGGDTERSHLLAKAGLETAQRQGDTGASALLATSLFTYELGHLHLSAARSYARTVNDAADPNDPPALIRSMLCKALLSGYAGRWDRVVRTCEEWMAQVRLASNYQLATARFCWSEGMLALGDASSAHDTMIAALPNLGDMRPLGGLHLARVLACLGRDEEAASLVRRHSESVTASLRSTAAAGRAILGEVASLLEEPHLWRVCYEMLSQETRPLVMAYCPVSVERVLGRLAGRLKLWADAIQHFETASQQLGQGKALGELAKNYLDYAEMRRLRGRRGDPTKAIALELQAGMHIAELGVPQRSLAASTNGNRFGLTGRELEVLALVAKGRRNQEIAETLTLSNGTVTRHLENIFGKMDVRNRTEAVVRAVQDGLVGLKADRAME